MVCCYLNTGDAKSTGNLHKHARLCWGAEAMAAADETRNLGAAFEALKNVKDGSITGAFERVGKGKITYSHRQHTTTQTWYVNLSCRPRKTVKY